VVVIWDLKSRRRFKLKAHVGDIHALAFAPDGRTLVTGGASDGTSKLWDVPRPPQRGPRESTGPE
jgi:WD40 repeat protein